MAPSDGNQNTSLQSEALEKPVTAHVGEAKQISQTTNLAAFHCYMHLPFELREKIRTAAIRAAHPSINPWSRDKPCSRLASVSKEWQEDVERVLFAEIRIDPSDAADVARLKELFTEERKRFLTRFEIAIDDEQFSGLWHRHMGLLGISQVMEKIGKFFQYISGWNFSRDGEKQRSIEIIFTSSHQRGGHHDPKDDQPFMGVSSLWEREDRNVLTSHGLIPTNMVLWAIKSEFPSALNMVTHFTFLPDCVPLPAAQKIIQTMPNLETCVFEVKFGTDCEEGWGALTGWSLGPQTLAMDMKLKPLTRTTDFVNQLRTSAPFLRRLRLHSQNYNGLKDFVPPSMGECAAVLRDLSQSLEFFLAWPFDLHEAFFLPFSEELLPTAETSQWKWPRLQNFELRSFIALPNLGPDQLTLTPTDILIAAGRAARAMPALKSATISADAGQYFYITRESYSGVGGKGTASMALAEFEESEERRILIAWAHFIGAETRFIEEKKFKTLSPVRIYETLTKDGVES